MKPPAENLVKRVFPKDFTDRDRAIFESGVAMGSIIHAITGIPYARRPGLRRDLEKALASSFQLQPYREAVKIRLHSKKKHRNPYDYDVLKPEDIEAAVTIAYGRYRVVARLRYIPRIRYPLAYVSKVERI
jgi:hypothetical protein